MLMLGRRLLFTFSILALFLFLCRGRSTHHLNLVEQTDSTISHKQRIKKHIDFGLEECDKVLALDELRVQITRPLDADLVTQLLYLI